MNAKKRILWMAILLLAGGPAAGAEKVAASPGSPDLARCRPRAARGGRPEERADSCVTQPPKWSLITGPNDAGSTDWWSYPGSSNAAYGIGLPPVFAVPNPGASGYYPDADQSGPCHLTWRPGYDDSVRYDGLNPGTPPLSVYAWNGSGWEQQTGLIGRHAAVIQRSVFLANIGGLSFTAAFHGGNTTSANGQAVVQHTMFFASQRCLTAGTEFGFFRQVDGSSLENSLLFYWGLNENCPEPDTHTWYCATSTDGGKTYSELQTQISYGVFHIPIPSLDRPWRYSVWLSGGPGAYFWNFRVSDASGTQVQPCDESGHTFGCATSATPGGPSDPFNDYAAAMLRTAEDGGLRGYIFLGTVNAQPDTYFDGSPAPSMTVGEVWAPGY